jgi:hypothetical protein
VDLNMEETVGRGGRGGLVRSANVAPSESSDGTTS